MFNQSVVLCFYASLH